MSSNILLQINMSSLQNKIANHQILQPSLHYCFILCVFTNLWYLYSKWFAFGPFWRALNRGQMSRSEGELSRC